MVDIDGVPEAVIYKYINIFFGMFLFQGKTMRRHDAAHWILDE